MRRSRLTFQNAFHHIMNRGINGENIFQNDDDKLYFIKLLKDKIKLFRIRLLAYCLLNNHYHISLQNTSNKLSDFMKQVNGEYGMYYRKVHGGKGYVFQNRYKSTLIQDNKYLIQVILYILLNPVKAKITGNAFRYNWSSINEYFKNNSETITDVKFIEELFQTPNVFCSLLQENTNRILSPKITRFGNILGDEQFIKSAIKKYDRRKEIINSTKKRILDNKFSFNKAEEIIRNFEFYIKIKINTLDINTLYGKQIRTLLLVELKEKAGLTYSQINEYPLFQSLKYSSLREIYRRAHKKIMLQSDAPSPIS